MSNGQSKFKGETAVQRRERLAAELRANLVKRKAQAKARARDAGDASIELEEVKRQS